MNLLHLAIIAILTSGLVVYDNAYAGDETTAYGGLVRSHQNMTSGLPSPPLGMYPYTSKIFSVFQIDPEIVHPNDTSSIRILVTNNANCTLYDVNLGESSNDSKSMLFSNIHKIDILNPNQTKTIYGTLHVSADVQPTNYHDMWWNVIAKNETGNMMESMQFHRNLPITQNLPYYSGPVVITLESPLKQFKSGIKLGDVQCNTGFKLIFKSYDSSPACVKLDTAYNLMKRGWAASESAYPGNDSQFALYTNSTIIPVHLPRAGARALYSESSQIRNSSGFVGVYNTTLMYSGMLQDYVLEPGNTGTITFEIKAQVLEQPGQIYPAPLPKSINLTNYVVFYHEVTSIKELAKYPGTTIDGYDFKACSTGPAGGGACIGGESDGKNPIEAYVVDHPGVNVLFEPPVETLSLDPDVTSQTVTMTITADSNATKGTYLMIFSPFGQRFLFTVGNQPYHE